MRPIVVGQVSQAERLAHKEKVRTRACKCKSTCMGCSFFSLRHSSYSLPKNKRHVVYNCLKFYHYGGWKKRALMFSIHF